MEKIRNIKKMNSDNELNKNLEYTSGEDPDKEIDNDFIYETDNSGNGLMKPYLKNWMMHLLD